MAWQADGLTPLEVLGEIHIDVTQGKHTYRLDALIMDQLNLDILAGNNFFNMYDIVPQVAKWHIIIGGSEIITYGPSSDIVTSTIHHAHAFIVSEAAGSNSGIP